VGCILAPLRGYRTSLALTTKIQSTNPTVSAARAAAFDILLRVERDLSYAPELLHASAYEDFSPRDHALLTELVMGVLRWRSRLDDEIVTASSQPLHKLDLEILIALRMALYQFRCLDRVPKRAALHESVELVKRARKRSAAPFVNAVLRKLSEVAERSKENFAEMKPFLSDEQPETLARVFAHPEWMVERWVRAYGFTATREICKYNQQAPVTAIRLRERRATPQGAEARILQEGIKWNPGALLVSARRIEAGEITKTPAFREGQIVIQDEGSQLVAALVGNNLEPGAKILDCCAAPGGKTLAIADRNPRAEITAVELHPHRARLLQSLLNRTSNSGKIRVVAADARTLPTSILFERVLADVPCSGTGTLARNPEIKWRIGLEDIRELQARQIAILRSAMTRVAAGGRAIYSTCSLEREENEDVVEKVLSEDSSFRVIDCRAELERMKAAGELTWTDVESLTRGPYMRTIPGIHPCDGFFEAVLEKNQS
jgi:16S rRNA (cytosine967-C5)-methyltransferase